MFSHFLTNILKRMMTGFVYHPGFLNHDPGPGHPESRERLIAVMDYLEQRHWFKALQQFTPKPADREWIELIHSSEYIERVKATCRSGAAFLDSTDVGICELSYDTALLAAGAPLALADEIIAHHINNGFALIRPPGHHAESNMALGFCLFNNIAILARYLQRQHGLSRIVIMDWDVHHGNGTQHSFFEDPSVFYISTHQYPYYPGTGAGSETGSGPGKGATLNCPMPAHSTDQDYTLVFQDRIIPAIQSYNPEIILISAGFDAHIDDPLAQIDLSTGFFGWMTDRLMELADQYCGGRIISVLEGGYNLQALPLCIEQHLLKLASVE
jgi:acetoin utilization deacetylase AcuC-like enzyme